MINLPIVSIVIPCRNEELWIERCIESVLNNDYPKDLLELFIVDGLSTDKTVEIALKYSQKYSFMRVLKNEKRIFPAAINIAFNNSKGDVFIILGAHAEYSSNYITENVRALYEYNVDNVGGLVEQVWPVKNTAGKAITTVLSSRFGIGDASYRIGTNKPLLVRTVFGGCYRRSVFEKIGMFNESLIGSSDIDFNIRLNRNGGKILLIPDVKVRYYYAETNVEKFIRNNLRNGFWTIFPLKFVGYIPVTLRHLVPLFFVSGLISLIILSFFSISFIWIFLLLLGIYLVVSIVYSLKKIKEGLGLFFMLPSFYFLLHFSYGLGSLYGLFTILLSKQFYILHFSNTGARIGISK